jgi:hypothetical protein
LFYQAVYLQTPLDAALSSLPYCAVLVVFSAVSGAIVSLVRRYRVVLWVGWLLMTTFIGLFCLLDNNTSRAEAYSFQIMARIGSGIVLTVTAFPIQASVRGVDTGLAVGMTVVFRLFGGLIGLTTDLTVFTTVFQQKFNVVETLPEVLNVLENSSQAIGFIPELRMLNVLRESLDVLIGVYDRPFQAIWLL